MKSITKRIWTGLSAMAAAIVMFASSTAVTQAQTSPLKIKVSIAQSGPQATVWLADVYGLFKEQGLDVEILNFRNPADMLSAGVSGAANLISSGVETPAVLGQRGVAPWRNIVASYGASAFSLVTQTSLNIKPGDYKALKGLKLGVSGLGRPSNSVAKVLLQQNGLDPENDVTYVDQPPGPEGVVAWERKLADAAIVNEPVTSGLLIRKSATMFVDLREGKSGPVSQVPQATVAAPIALINTNRAELEKFVLAVCLATKRAVANPNEAAEMLAKRWGADTGADATIVKAGIVASAIAFKTDIPEAPTMAWMKLLVDTKVLKEMPKFEDVVDMSFSKNWRC